MKNKFAYVLPVFLQLLLIPGIMNQAKAAQVLQFSDMKLLSTATTNQVVFDESVNLAPNFGVSQNDPDLKPYFSPKTGFSELCVPTTFSHFLTYQMGITHQLPISTSVPGVSSDLQSIDMNALIVDLAHRLKTDYTTGTTGDNFVSGINDVMMNYFGKSVSIDKILNSTSPRPYPQNVRWQNRDPELVDIRNALSAGDPLIGDVDWYHIDTTTKNWVYDGGHVFMIYGYSRESYFQENMLELALMNPKWIWTNSTTSADFDNTLAMRSTQDQTSSIFFEGRGFQGQTQRGFLKSLTTVHISN